MTDEERFERFKRVLINAEMEIKMRIVEIAEEQLDTGAEKVGLVTALSLGMAAAALHSACEAVEERNEQDVGSVALGLFTDNVTPELARLRRAMGNA